MYITLFIKFSRNFFFFSTYVFYKHLILMKYKYFSIISYRIILNLLLTHLCNGPFNHRTTGQAGSVHLLVVVVWVRKVLVLHL